MATSVSKRGPLRSLRDIGPHVKTNSDPATVNARKEKTQRLRRDNRITKKATPASRSAKLSAALMKVIKEKQWSLADLSKESGISIGHLSRLISGDRDHSPTLRTLECIANVCKIPLNELL